MDDRQSKIDLVRKLLILADNNDSITEANLAREKARLVREKYNILDEELYQGFLGDSPQPIVIDLNEVQNIINGLLNNPEISDMIGKMQAKQIDEEERSLPKHRKVIRAALRGFADKLIRKYF